MARYFVDTSCLVGMSFLHDSWYRDAKLLYDEGNDIVLTEFVFYEYCNRDRENDPSIVGDPTTLDVTHDGREGVFGKKYEELENILPHFERHIDQLAIDGLTMNKLVKSFIEHFDIRDDDIPAVVAYFENYFESRELIAANAKPCVKDLIDSILYVAQKNKQRILDAADVLPSVYHEQDEIRRQIGDIINPWNLPDEDRDVIVDAIHLSNRGEIDMMVTGDKKHQLRLQEDIGDLFDLKIISIADKFQNPELRDGYL